MSTPTLTTRKMGAFANTEMRRYHSGGWHPVEGYVWDGSRWAWANLSDAQTWRGLSLNDAKTDWDHPQAVWTTIPESNKPAVLNDTHAWAFEQTANGRQLNRYLRSTGERLNSTAIPHDPLGLALTPDGSELVLLAAIPFNNQLWVTRFNPATFSSPGTLAFSEDDNSAFSPVQPLNRVALNLTMHSGGYDVTVSQWDFHSDGFSPTTTFYGSDLHRFNLSGVEQSKVQLYNGHTTVTDSTPSYLYHGAYWGDQLYALGFTRWPIYGPIRGVVANNPPVYNSDNPVSDLNNGSTRDDVFNFWVAEDRCYWQTGDGIFEAFRNDD